LRVAAEEAVERMVVDIGGAPFGGEN